MKETDRIRSEYHQVRQNCGYFVMSDWTLVSATGEDTLGFLQSQTTNDVQALQAGQGQNSAITDRQARLVANFSVHRTEEHAVLFLMETSQKERLLGHLQGYLFREDVTLNPRIPQDTLLAIQGPKSALTLKQLVDGLLLPQKPNDTATITLNNEKVLVINKSLTGEEGFVLAFPRPLKDFLIESLCRAGQKYGLIALGKDTREVLRIEAGLPLFGRDMDSKNVLPETGLEHTSVSYNKGCYIGQEVIARIKTYGFPPAALMGLIFEWDTLPPYDADIFMESKKIGKIKSSVPSIALGKIIALAYLQKDYRIPGREMQVTLQDSRYTIETVLLPFYQTRSARDHAQRLLQKALTLYKEKENLDEPIALLREAIEMDPKNARAYESLGVMLSKQNKLDEAIGLMKRLAEIDPGEIMAHTNLSIYYMKQGRIEDAENEKAEATALQFEKLLMDKKAEKAKQAEDQQRKLEMEKKIGMFQQVLEIDPVDQVANFGLGSVYFELGRYKDALPPLRTLVEKWKNYSAAYLLLGKNLEKLSHWDEAVEVYKKGIAAASKKGDLMPLRDMQSRLNQLLQSKPAS